LLTDEFHSIPSNIFNNHDVDQTFLKEKDRGVHVTVILLPTYVYIRFLSYVYIRSLCIDTDFTILSKTVMIIFTQALW